MNNESKTPIKDVIELEDCAYLVVRDERLGLFTVEIQPSDYWVGGDEGGYTSDSNIYFDSADDIGSYYDRNYIEYWVFESQGDADDYYDKLEAKKASE